MAYDNKYVIQMMMKIRNKLVAVLCAMSCVMCLMGCGGTEGDSSKKDKETAEHSDSKGDVQDSEKGEDMSDIGDSEEEKLEISLTLNGVKYDLMGNFNETVGKMVQDGLIVYRGTDYILTVPDEENGFYCAQRYDDNGNLINVSMNDHEHNKEIEDPQKIYALTYKNELVYDGYTVYEYRIPLEFLLSYETLNYITQDSTKEEVLQAEGGHMVDKPDSAQVVHYLYVDGKQINISEYEEEARTFYCEDNSKYETYEDIINSIIIRVRNTWAVKTFDTRWFNNIERIKETPEDKLEERIDYLTIFLALSDAFEMIKTEDADSVCIVTCSAEAPRTVHYAIYQCDYVK